MEIGIAGLAQSGKTTLFQSLTKGKAIGVVKVPDPRLNTLQEIFHPQKTVQAEITYVDSNPPPKGLPPLSTADALILVLRSFKDEGIPHPEGSIDPKRDFSMLNMEFALSDLTILERRMERITSSLKGGKVQRDKLLKEKALLLRLKEALERETPIREQELTEEEGKIIEGYNLFTAKPIMAVLNIGEEELPQAPALEGEWLRLYPGVKVAALCAKLEMELSQLSEPDASEFRAALGLKEGTVDRVIRLSYELLGLISFFTIVSNEVRAWTIKQGAVAPKAAGKVHSDMERGFIRAEVVSFNDLVKCGSLAEARRQGLLRIEGKNYVVQDGDIITFLFHI
jgi:hypothetical protein